ncbi:aldo/keto reductase [Granulicoccus phenolivorans]|uniref:aldo/keto reductase n=1 Tax=Granulicoccus phenolivorans TaxID=266854 RepID=UPI00041258B8|nr:aldo/keto reductase [Granulicoccus phenolivorans]
MTVPDLVLNDGHTIPQLGFGVWQISSDDIVPALRTALETGYRHIDTAAIYGNEEGVGQAIRESGIPREELFITTKLWNDRHTDAPAALAESLEKLGLDQVDLYLIHWAVPGTYVQAWLALEDLQRQGLTRSIGVSNFLEHHLTDVLEAGSVVPAVNQIEVHPSHTRPHLRAFNDEHGILTQSWSPLGRNHDIGNPLITHIAEEVGRTPAQVILRWHLQNDLIVFPRSVTPSRIRENIALFDFELTTEQKEAIDGLNRDNRVGGDPENPPA